MKKTHTQKIKVMENYHKPKFMPNSAYLSEMALLHSKHVSSVGGEQPLNDANTKVMVGESDFNGTLLPTDANGFLDAVVVKYGKKVIANLADVNPAVIDYSEIYAEFPAWLRNSELVLKTGGLECFRMRVSETTLSTKSDKITTEWAKELVKTIKTLGGQDLQLFLTTPKGAVLDATENMREFVQVTLYGTKFIARKSA